MFVMVTVAGPELCWGTTATMVEELLSAMEAAGNPPKVTDTPARKFAPLIVTFVPPAAGPEAGDTLLTVREDVPNVNPPGSAALVLSALVTATLTDPEACGGVVAVSWFPLTKETADAGVPPKETVAPRSKFDPVIVTAVPPAVAPEFGVTLLTARAEAV